MPAFKTISVGHNAACGITVEGRTLCWGGNYSGEAWKLPQTQFTQVVALPSTTCGVTQDGTPVCWGDDEYEDSIVRTTPNDIKVTRIEGSKLRACGIKADGSGLVCWGENPYAADLQIDDLWVDRDQICYTEPKTGAGHCIGGQAYDTPEGTKLSAIEGACGLTEQGELTCWFDQGDAPVGEKFKKLSLSFQSCGLQEDGTIKCWNYGAVSAGPPPDIKASDLAVGWTLACGLRAENGQAFCWGPDGAEFNAPNARRYTSVSVGDRSICATQVDGSTQCWGGGLGEFDWSALSSIQAAHSHVCGLDKSSRAVCHPAADAWTAKTPDEPLQALYVSQGGACGTVKDTGEIKCWGQAPDPDKAVTQPQIGVGMGCGLDAAEKLHCWGDVPTTPETLGDVKKFAVGRRDLCVILEPDGLLRCFGPDAASTKAPEGFMASDIAVGQDGACAISAKTKTVTCWGDKSEAEEIYPGLRFTSIAHGLWSACGIQEDTQQLRCWGEIIVNPL